jgi:hypothetical protein
MTLIESSITDFSSIWRKLKSGWDLKLLPAGLYDMKRNYKEEGSKYCRLSNLGYRV